MSIIQSLDVQKLAADPSPQSRADTARKVAMGLEDNAFSKAEMEIAFSMLRLLVRDAAVAVRTALADVLHRNPWVPPDVAEALASDIDTIALPMLEFSPALRTEFLLSIVHERRSMDKLRAIAARPLVPETVTEALIECGDESVVKAAVNNTSVFFSTRAFDLALDRFGQLAEVNEPLSYRSDLPASVFNRVLTLVADGVRVHLIEAHNLDPNRVGLLASAARDRAMLEMSRDFTAVGFSALFHQLREDGRLNPQLILRSVCMGYLAFFEYAIATLANHPPGATRILLRDPNGVASICRRAKFPAAMIPIATIALEAARELEAEGRGLSATQFSRRVVERVMTVYDEIGANLGDADVEHLIASFDQLPNA